MTRPTMAAGKLGGQLGLEPATSTGWAPAPWQRGSATFRQIAIPSNGVRA